MVSCLFPQQVQLFSISVENLYSAQTLRASMGFHMIDQRNPAY